MPASIWSHGQSTLPDGRVLVSGGYGSGAVNNVYIYEPNSNTWSEVASLPNGLNSHGQSVLLDGMVMVSGFGQTYTYSSDGDKWESITPLATSYVNHGHKQTTLFDNRVFVSGGWSYSNGGLRNTAYVYVLSSDSWAETASVPVGVWFHGQSILFDGKILVSGGSNTASGSSGNYNTAYIYAPTGTGAWATASPMPTNFSSHAQSTLLDGRVLVSGGNSTNFGIRNTAYIYTLSTDEWTSASPMPTAIRDHGQSTLVDGRVLVSGGNNGTNAINTAYIYTPTGWVDTFLVPATNRHRKRSYFACQYIRTRSIHPV